MSLILAINCISHFWAKMVFKRHALMYTWMEFQRQAHMDGVEKSRIPYNLGKNKPLIPKVSFGF